VLYCLRGSIRFDLAGGGFDLGSGDRLEIPAGIAHSAQAGAHGVACIEAARG
jgi:quercetin dioxygenase-like cupin family protein